METELGPVFAHLFQQSIDKGEIPKEWSIANIFPFSKKEVGPLLQLSSGVLDLIVCTLQVTRTHSMLKHYGSS